MKLLTDKAKQDFEEWLVAKLSSDSPRELMLDFDKLTPNWKINWYKKWLSTTTNDFRVAPNFGLDVDWDFILINKDDDKVKLKTFKGSESEATNAAIEKANELYNLKHA